MTFSVDDEAYWVAAVCSCECGCTSIRTVPSYDVPMVCGPCVSCGKLRSLDTIPVSELFIGKRVRSIYTDAVGSIQKIDETCSEGVKIWIEWDNKNWTANYKFVLSGVIEEKRRSEKC